MKEEALRSLSGVSGLFHGPGSAARLMQCLPAGRLAIVTGTGLPAQPGPGKVLLERLCQEFDTVHLPLDSEPSDLWVDQARERLKDTHPAAVLSLGGGSVLDAGKALAAMLCEPEPTLRYLEGVGDLRPSGAMLPWFALPTTAGTGSEASTNAVLSRPGPDGFKKSLRHPGYRAAGITLDAELSQGLPPLWTAACGMDAVTQLFESWSSVKCPPDLKPHLEEALARAIASLPRAVDDAPDSALEDRQTLLDAAFLSGIGLSRAGLGTCHGLAGPIGGRRPLPHAIVSARLMGPCIRETLPFLPESPLLPLLRQTLSWAERFRIPSLAAAGWTQEDTEAILPQAGDRNSPAALGPEIWRNILQTA